MANNLFNAMGGGMQMNPLAQIAQQARQFRQSFTGNPRQEVERLLQSGQMSQADFNRFSQIAQQVVQFMGDN
ncbi:MAG: hypothetical protein J6K17_00190 [Oscillospiraceae bacterium]|nr:hypothetical protein [Oscillospiraceae bacterium]